MILVMLLMIPIAAGLLAWYAERFHARAPFWISIFSMLAVLAIAISIWTGSPSTIIADVSGNRWLIEFNAQWIPQFGISIHLGIDGLSLVLVLLTALIGLMAVMSSWSEITEKIGFFYANLMFISAGILGVFLSLDLFLFYFFWELMLVPMYFMISIWGHENRAYASVKFFIFTQASGLLMFISILGLYFAHGQATGIYTFDYTQLLGTQLSTAASLWLMAGFSIAFAVKLPVVPFHTWLADAHTEAPTAGSIILAGLMLKTGAYGFLRFVLPLFPEAASMIAYPAMIAGTISVLYGASLAFSQTDLKRLVAYTSISHMGFVLIGIFAFNVIALQGAVIQMVSHAISTGMLFFIVGALQERIHTRDLTQMGGMWSTAPRMGAAALIFAMASLGLPGMGNFIGEFLLLLGAYAANITISVIAATGLIAATVYSVWFMHVTFYSKAETTLQFSDLNIRELIVTSVMVLAIFWIGLFPQPLLDMSRAAIQKVQMQTVDKKPLRLTVDGSIAKEVRNEQQ
jgi:NADH-quinone oxidoreductase subunit M